MRDAEDRAKLEEFTAKGGVGMELPEAKAAVATAKRLIAAQEKVSTESTDLSCVLADISRLNIFVISSVLEWFQLNHSLDSIEQAHFK